MMEAALTSETSVDNYFTRQYIPEDKPELHTRRRENLKFHGTCIIAGAALQSRIGIVNVEAMAVIQIRFRLMNVPF
jgi:hypothetical protein